MMDETEQLMQRHFKSWHLWKSVFGIRHIQRISRLMTEKKSMDKIAEICVETRLIVCEKLKVQI